MLAVHEIPEAFLHRRWNKRDDEYRCGNFVCVFLHRLSTKVSSYFQRITVRATSLDPIKQRKITRQRATREKPSTECKNARKKPLTMQEPASQQNLTLFSAIPPRYRAPIRRRTLHLTHPCNLPSRTRNHPQYWHRALWREPGRSQPLPPLPRCVCRCWKPC
jgi:hypothetical protein